MEDKMENPIQIFEHEQFGKIRVVIIDGIIYFVAADVCRALDIKNPTMSMKQLGDDERAKFNLGLPYGEVNIVNEPGFYRLVFSSRKKEARAFQWWVYHEVLPSIRKTGSYSIVDEKTKSKLAPNPRRRAAQLRDSHVYAFLMSDNTVKIGIAGDVEKRMPQIERKYKLTVVNHHCSPLMTRKDALKLETMCKKIFSPYRTEGEFFSVNFRSACALIDSYSKIIDEHSDLNRSEKLLEIVDMMIDSLEKQNLLISSGKLIAGEKFS